MYGFLKVQGGLLMWNHPTQKVHLRKGPSDAMCDFELSLLYTNFNLRSAQKLLILIKTLITHFKQELAKCQLRFKFSGV